VNGKQQLVAGEKQTEKGKEALSWRTWKLCHIYRAPV